MIVFEEAWELRNLQALAIEEECWGSQFFCNFVVIKQKLCLCHHVEYSLPILPNPGIKYYLSDSDFMEQWFLRVTWV